MVIETTYKINDLTYGICKSCGEKSNEIVIGDGRCLDCLEADNFYEITMKGI